MTALFETPSDNETEPSDSDSDQDAQGDVMELPVDEFEKKRGTQTPHIGVKFVLVCRVRRTLGPVSEIYLKGGSHLELSGCYGCRWVKSGKRTRRSHTSISGKSFDSTGTKY